MDLLVAAFVSFFGVWLLSTHLAPRAMRRLVGYAGWFDLMLHGSILLLFLGTSTLGLLQAEAAGICFSLYLRAYRHLQGYERITPRGWVRFAGRWT